MPASSTIKYLNNVLYINSTLQLDCQSTKHYILSSASRLSVLNLGKRKAINMQEVRVLLPFKY